MGCSLSRPSEVVPISVNGRPGRRVSSSVGAAWESEGQRTPPATASPSTVTLVHFNDVYNIGEREKEPVGGAARFKTKLDSLQHLEPLILFSGDALNPSNSEFTRDLLGNKLCYSSLPPTYAVSTVTQGKQMIPVLNAFSVHAAVYGNHDFGELPAHA